MCGTSQIDARRKIHCERLGNVSRILMSEWSHVQDARRDEEVVNAAEG
jgi:hypothetical protein